MAAKVTKIENKSNPLSRNNKKYPRGSRVLEEVVAEEVCLLLEKSGFQPQALILPGKL